MNEAAPSRSSPKLSAGLLLYCRVTGDDAIVLEVLLARMGGPFWARKDSGAWSIPKGEYSPGEAPLAAAKREFEEEMGSAPPSVVFHDLGSVSQPGGKLVRGQRPFIDSLEQVLRHPERRPCSDDDTG